jgi:hypothetical protein
MVRCKPVCDQTGSDGIDFVRVSGSSEYPAPGQVSERLITYNDPATCLQENFDSVNRLSPPRAQWLSGWLM